MNLRAADHRLLREPVARPRALDAPSTYLATWGNYLRSLCAKGFWYRFATRPSCLFYISENKALAGREERGSGEAVGRPLVLTFFEEIAGGIVRRVDRASSSMRPWLLTIAELLIAAGVWLPPDPERSPRDAEAMLEDLFVEQNLQRLKGTVEPDAPEVHMYQLGEAVDAEAAFLAETPPQSLTKVALARCLELHGGEPRRISWQQKSLESLRASAQPFLEALRGSGHGEDEAATEALEPEAPAAPPKTAGRRPKGAPKGRAGRGGKQAGTQGRA